jgi:hypothetical protein
MPRKDFYGSDLNWYAVDSAGRIGQFTAGYAPVPTVVFSDETLLARVQTHFEHCGDRCRSSLSKAVAGLHRAGGAPDHTAALAQARKGIFVFGETGEQGAPTYLLEAIPSNPMLVGELPKDLGAAVSLVRFRNIFFSQVLVFEPGLLIPCER